MFLNNLEDVMKIRFLLIIIILLGMLAGCNLVSTPATSTSIPTPASTLAFIQPTSTPPVILSPVTTIVVVPPTPRTTDQAVLDRAAQVVEALKDKDMAALASYVSPQKGLRFSPYAAIQETYRIFTADQVIGLSSDHTNYTWGAYSGTGETIELPFIDYYAKFIYDVDFANAPQLSLNHRLGVSTTLDNSAEFYPGAMIVEYYFPGFDPTLEGMDWRSLRLAFMQENGSWYLVGIIHDQWTT